MKERRTTDPQGNVNVQQWADDDYPAAFANEDALKQALRDALIVNSTFIKNQKPTTTAAQASQAYDQTVRLSKEVNGLIRSFLNLLDDISDTV